MDLVLGLGAFFGWLASAEWRFAVLLLVLTPAIVMAAFWIVRGARGLYSVAEWQVITGVVFAVPALFFGVAGFFLGLLGEMFGVALLGLINGACGTLVLVFRHPAWDKAY